MASRALVWFKRDLRLSDHAPLAAARLHDAALALFIVEPAWLQSAEFDAQHAEFALACLHELHATLAARGLPLWVAVGEAATVLGELRRRFAFTHLLSHEETGPGWSFDRDRAVAAWCREHGVQWQEWPQTGVVRRLKTRSGWAANWSRRMNAAPAASGDAGFAGAPDIALSALPALPTLASLGLHSQGRPLPRAGEAAARATLASFVQGRGRGYRRALSSPLTAEEGCSRLSAHLAFGTVSMRCVHQATEAAIARACADAPEPAAGANASASASSIAAPDRGLAHALRGFAGRLRWHCHFMQKLEDEPSVEFRNFARVYDGLRPGDGPAPTALDRERFEAWCAGQTGFPMVDACMRSVCATGWLNFRMRAMLVSFASYHLWLHWRETGSFLARQFLDFEAGIHWSQMQMQSGTTGINTLRIYSPAKQALDHDPHGVFVRRWVPEYGTRPYPAPIVDERAALRHAKERLYGLRQTPEARAEASEVQQRHGSRKSGLPQVSSGRGEASAPGSKRTRRTNAAEPSPQRSLFDDLFDD